MLTGEDDARAYCESLVDEQGFARLERLVELLKEENQHQNLVAANSLDEVWMRHMADSLQLLAHHQQSDKGLQWLDLGTGAGFPGLALAAARPSIGFTFVESRRRRCEWLSNAGAALGLTNITVKHARLECVEAFAADVISARAFAPLEKLLRLSARFSTSGTLWLLPKGRSARQEILDLPAAKRKMFHVEPSRTAPEAGIVVGRGRITP